MGLQVAGGMSKQSLGGIRELCVVMDVQCVE